MASVTELVSDDFAPIRCVTWAVEDAADDALAPNAQGRLFVLATADGWPVAMVDARADSSDAVAEIVRCSAAEQGVRAPSGFIAGRAVGTR